MIDLKYLKTFYGPREQIFDKNIMKEYLQYQILEIIFDSKYGTKLCFLGGTCIRIIYNSQRFSEDLDFDNFGIEENDFGDFTNIVQTGLSAKGYSTNIKNVYKGAYRCYIKIPKVLYNVGLSNLEEENILIQLDTVKQSYSYDFKKELIDKFDIYSYINSCPIDILLSKKIHALLDRKRAKGRDIYDVTFLYKFTKPNFDYLQFNIGIPNVNILKERLFKFIEGNSLKDLGNDLIPFLINPSEINRVLEFKNFVNEL